MKLQPVSRERLDDHVRHLCEEIGVRLAGTSGDEAAAAYCEGEFRRTGAHVRRESFQVRSRDVARESLEILIGDAWLPFPSSLFSNTPGTGGQPIEAPLVLFEAPAEVRMPDLSHLRGRAVIHLGCHIESREAYARLIEAKPAFLLFVDIRYPGAVPLADGMFPSYSREIGAVPTVNVAYQDAWRWVVEGARAARLIVEGGMRPAASENVIAELPGADPDAPVIFLGAHHDTQAGSVGADDNASGVAGILELARVLAPLWRKRTIRLISFGAEEQLSVGSAVYVRARAEELAARGGLIINFDSFGSPMGWTEIIANGPREIEDLARRTFEERSLYVKILRDIMPYADHFPFVAAGVPGMTIQRSNCAAGRFFHHRPDDDPSRISCALMARILDPVAALVADLAAAPVLPFEAAIPQDQAREVHRFWVDLFGG